MISKSRSASRVRVRLQAQAAGLVCVLRKLSLIVQDSRQMLSTKTGTRVKTASLSHTTQSMFTAARTRTRVYHGQIPLGAVLQTAPVLQRAKESAS